MKSEFEDFNPKDFVRSKIAKDKQEEMTVRKEFEKFLPKKSKPKRISDLSAKQARKLLLIAKALRKPQKFRKIVKKSPKITLQIKSVKPKSLFFR